MTIHLPLDVERDIRKEVDRGRFANVDEALAEAWRTFQQRRPPSDSTTSQGLIGSMRDEAELLEQVTNDIMEDRRTRTLRSAPDE